MYDGVSVGKDRSPAGFIMFCPRNYDANMSFYPVIQRLMSFTCYISNVKEQKLLLSAYLDETTVLFDIRATCNNEATMAVAKISHYVQKINRNSSI